MTPQKKVLLKKNQRFFKLSSLTTLLLVMLLCAGKLSAQEVVTNGGDSGAGSLRQAISAVPVGGTITFSPTVTTVNLTTNQLVINKSLTIDGGGKVTIQRSASNFSVISIYNTGASINVAIKNLAITGGMASNFGGGIRAEGNVALTVDGCRIYGNQANASGAGGSGGGIFLDGEANSALVGGILTATISNSTIENNTAPGTNAGNNKGRGAGIYLNYGTLTVKESIIRNNTASWLGGGIHNARGTIAVEKSLIANNTSTGSGGGGAYLGGIAATKSTFKQNTIVNNTSSTNGGAINFEVGTGAFYNNTIVGNNATGSVGGVYAVNPTAFALGGNIIAGNKGSDLIKSFPTAPLTSEYNLYTTGIAASLKGATDQEIALASIGTILPGSVSGSQFNPTLTGNVVLPVNSGLAALRIIPAAQMASYLPSITTDQRNVFINTDDGKYCAGSVSMSLCPSTPNKVLYVNQSLAGATAYGEGLTAAYPFKELSDALASQCLQAGDTIKIANGTFNFTSTIVLNKNIAIIGTNNSAIIQRSAAAATPFSMVNAVNNTTTPLNILFRGLTIQNAQAESASAINVVGLVNFTVDTCTIQNNASVGDPANLPFTGAVYAVEGANGKPTLTITRSIFDHNTANNPNNKGRGGALYVYNGATVNVSKCVFTNNEARMGGAIYNKNGTLMVEKSLLKENKTLASGGAAFYADADPLGTTTSTFKQNTFTGNIATWAAAMALGTKSVNYLYNNTIVGNTAGEFGGVYVFDNANATLVGNIIAGNTGTTLVNKDAANNGGTIAGSTYNIFSIGTATTVKTANDQEVTLPTDILAGSGVAGTDHWIMPLQTAFNALNIVPSSNLSNLSDANDQRGVAIEVNNSNYFAGSVSLTCVAMTGGTISGSQNVYVGTVPTQPLNGLTAASGGQGTISYQWQESTDNVTFTNIAGATASAYTVTTAITADKWYRREAKGSVCGTTYSNTVKLTATNPASQTLSVVDISRVYGDAPIALTATASSGLPVTFSISSGDACTLSSNTLTITKAGTMVLKADQAGNASNAPASAFFNVTISKADMKVTVKDVTRSYGESNPSSYEWLFLSPFMYSDTKASINQLPTVSTTANSYSAMGTYAITLSGGLADSYNIIPVNATLNVTMVMPTAFTPYDLDGKNDVFATGLDIKVFNRNGTLMYAGKSGWDGKYKGELVTPTVYFYTAIMPDGSTKKGSIEVMRK